MCIRIDVTTVTERALHWRTNRMIDDEYHNFIANNLHLRVQIKNEVVLILTTRIALLIA